MTRSVRTLTPDDYDRMTQAALLLGRRDQERAISPAPLTAAYAVTMAAGGCSPASTHPATYGACDWDDVRDSMADAYRAGWEARALLTAWNADRPSHALAAVDELRAAEWIREPVATP